MTGASPRALAASLRCVREEVWTNPTPPKAGDAKVELSLHPFNWHPMDSRQRCGASLTDRSLAAAPPDPPLQLSSSQV